MAAAPLRTLRNTALFICDLQEKFRPAIHEFPRVIATAQKMLRASQILDMPVFATTQNRARLGETCSDLRLDVPGGFATKIHADKTLFSMWTPEVKTFFSSGQEHAIVIVGIESHICVLQTTLDLLREGHKVYVLADGVSSCNKEEVPIALARLRAEGAVITTSESFIYERMGDAGIAGFKEMAKLVKETKESTSQTLQALCKV
ncbi:Isochorismatase-like protein [Phyllosticta citricarpa]|uniref:Isochorismatase-like protein n=2 Tax=Phyllosticta TaxID=121621 RepID=A0ABR1MT62_9PEZI